MDHSTSLALLLLVVALFGAAGCDGVDVPGRGQFADQNACNTLDCDDSDGCTVDSCDRVAGACVHTAASDDTVCKDATACDLAWVCAAGSCKATGQIDCDDGKPCTVDSCALPGGCDAAAVKDDTTCGAATPCYPQPLCKAGICVPQPIKACDDGNDCTADTCDNQASGVDGCKHTAIDDLQPCAGGANICWAGSCLSSPPAMVSMPAATFWMGCVPGDGQCQANESPRHAVQLSTYFLDQFEVRVADYASCVTDGACTPPDVGCSADARGNWGKVGMEQHPINCVSQAQAAAYCAWRLPGGTLPTEAQFEAALRDGADGQVYPAGTGLPPPAQSANLPDQSAASLHPEWSVLSGYDDGYAHTAPVGSFAANAAGLHDLWGNVWEWTRDWVDPAGYPTTQVSDPQGPASGSFKPIRGSGFFWTDTNASALRASYRLTTFAPSFFNNDLGFRCALDR